MPRFFVENLREVTVIEGTSAHHIIKSLRMREGEKIALCNMQGMEGEGKISEISEDKVTVTLGEIRPSLSEPNLKITLYVAFPKGDKAEFIIQKAVELGAVSIVFTDTERCVAKPDNVSFEKKLQRFRKISAEAAGQSQRGIIPTIFGIIPFKEAIAEMKKTDSAFMLYEGNCPPMRGEIKKDMKTLSLFTGSEGGFSEAEVSFAKENNITPVSLGKRILRCETAPLAALSAVLFFVGDMD